MSTRSPEEIRASLEAQRHELSGSIERLRSDVTEISDWRRHVRRNTTAATVAAAATGFLVAGGIGALTGLLRRR